MRQLSLLSLTALIATQTFAADVTLNGTVQTSVQINQHQLKNSASMTNKSITLLKVRLSKEATQHILQHRLRSHTPLAKASSVMSDKIDLGMNKVPVLDQGMYGTCVTFATTAAIDAALGQGDYVSQLCSLQLGTYLEDRSYQPSGWEGSWGRTVLSQFTNNGIVSKENETKLGCGGMHSYPTRDDVSGEMSVDEYHAMSQSLMDSTTIDWSPILDIYQAFSDKTNADKTINDIKKSLNEGERVTMGVLLVDYNQGLAGAVGKHVVNQDTWVLTPEMLDDLKTHNLEDIVAGHEMVIIGYDDNAVAKDDKGRTYQGLFKLRNSWGSVIGDKGDFYITYEYFKLLGIEANRIKKITG